MLLYKIYNKSNVFFVHLWLKIFVLRHVRFKVNQSDGKDVAVVLYKRAGHKMMLYHNQSDS